MQVPWVGGPVVRCPLLYNSFWGPSWGDATHQALANQINQFTQDLLASNFQNTLTQYGELTGAHGGAFIRASFLAGVPATLTVSSYEQIIQQFITAGVFPQPVDLNASVSVPMLMIYLDEHTVINGGGRQLNIPGAGDLAYHDSFVTANGQPCIYSFMAFLPLNEVTWVARHEFAEAITDPLYNAWTPDHLLPGPSLSALQHTVEIFRAFARELRGPRRQPGCRQQHRRAGFTRVQWRLTSRAAIPLLAFGRRETGGIQALRLHRRR